MPQFDLPLLTDLLFGLIVLLFVPFGIRRGVAKEAMVSAGLLFGAALAAAWLTPASDRLARLWNLEPEVSRFAVTLAGMIGGMLLLGYGGGAALGRMRPGILARLAGGVLAAGNGLLLLAFLLAAAERELNPGGWLDDGLVSRTLLRDLDWVLLAVGAVLLLCVLLGLVVSTFRRGREPRYAPSPLIDTGEGGVPVPPRQRPVRFARSGDIGKYEPTPDPHPGRSGANLAHTAPAVDAPADAWSRGHLRHAAPGNGQSAGPPQGATAPIGDDWIRRATAVQPNDSRAATDASRRCPRCGAPARATDIFCPECGQTI